MQTTGFIVFLLSVLAVSNGFAPTVQTRLFASRPSTAALYMAGEVKISAKMVSELRQKTDSPMMECKKALIEAEGDFAAAEEILRVKLGRCCLKKSSFLNSASNVQFIIHIFSTQEAKHQKKLVVLLLKVLLLP